MFLPGGKKFSGYKVESMSSTMFRLKNDLEAILPGYGKESSL